MDRQLTKEELSKVIKDVSHREVNQNNTRWSIYHIIHKYKHHIHMFKDGELFGFETIQDAELVEEKIEKIVKFISENPNKTFFKLSEIV